MISWTQIVLAAVITGVSVGLAAAAVRWPTEWAVFAGAATLALIVIWRGLSNRIGLNADFVPAVSPGDVGSFLAGAIGPMATLPLRWWKSDPRVAPRGRGRSRRLCRQRGHPMRRRIE